MLLLLRSNARSQKSISLIGMKQLGEVLDHRSTRGISLLAFAVAGLFALRNRSPLGWDESVYAARAKDLSNSGFDWELVTGGYWSDLRAPGFSGFVATGFEVFGSSDFVARAISIAFSVGLLWIIARSLDLLAEPRVGTTAVILAAICPGFLATSTLAFADHAGAFFAIVSLYFVIRGYVKGPDLGLVVVPIALGVATASRFGAAMFVAIPMVLLATAIVARAWRERELWSLWPYVASGGASAATVLILLSTTLLTTSNSPIDATSTFVDGIGDERTNWITDLRTILTPGPVDYGFDGAFWGWSYALLFVALVTVAAGRLFVAGRFAWMATFAAISLAPVVFYGLSVRRFVTTYLSPQFAIGVAMLAWALWLPTSRRGLAGAQSESSQRVADGGRATTPILVAGLSMALALFVGWRSFEGVDNMHERLHGFNEVREASVAASGLLGDNCELLTSRVPQVAWYSDCRANSFQGVLEPEDGSFEGLGWPEFVNSNAERIGVNDGDGFGFLVLEGVSTSPNLDQVWALGDQNRALQFSSPQGRRVVVVPVDVPE